jgi:hypothetical protein
VNPNAIATAAQNAYFAAWDQLRSENKINEFGLAAQDAASRGAWTEAAALLLCSMTISQLSTLS